MRTVSRRPAIQAGPASTRALDRLREQDIDVLGGWIRQPRQDPPEIPRDLPGLPDLELMDLFREVNQWRKYLRVQLVAAEIDESSAAAKARDAEAVALARSGARTVTAMKAAAKQDAGYAGAQALQADAYSYRKLVGALAENLEGDAFLISRELTRRTGEAPADRRNARRWQ